VSSVDASDLVTTLRLVPNNSRPFSCSSVCNSESRLKPDRAQSVSVTFGSMKIYTKTGDAGDTGLFGGGRVQKDDPRVEAYGDVDELNAVLGMARAIEPLPRIDEVLVPMQRDLFSIGALLATPDLAKMHGHLEKANIDDRRIKDLEHAIDDCEKELEPLRAFIIPGGSRKGAMLHVARTVCRRAERRVVHLQREVEIPPLVVIYLNRLSDLLFMLARVANVRTGAGEVTW
jgi:cob(I)alamin adenosyltransferase